MTTRHPIRPVGAALLAVVAGAVGGCAADRPDPLALGGEVRLPAIRESRASAPLRTEPSVSGASRAGWEQIDVVVPIDAGHGPAATSPMLDALRDSRRAEGRYPTAVSSVEVEPMLDSDSLYVVAAPIVSLADLFVIAGRWIGGVEPEVDEAYEPRQRSPLPQSAGGVAAPEASAREAG